MSKEKILVIVAARGGSKGIKNKNIRPLCGKPLIAHTILQAKQWGRADRLICSTDSEEIAGIAHQFGAQVPFMRPAELATDTAGKLDVLKHAVLAAEKHYQEQYQIIIDLDVTAPVRKISDIQGALDMFLDKRPKNIFSVTPSRKNPYFNMVEINQTGSVALSKDGGSFLRRQDAPLVYDANASIYVYDRDYLVDESTKQVISDKTLVYLMDEFSAFDIDSEVDFQFVEFLVNKGLGSL